jgi:hypothetical protein
MYHRQFRRLVSILISFVPEVCAMPTKIPVCVVACVWMGLAHAQTSPEQPAWQAPEGWAYVLEAGPPEIYQYGSTSHDSAAVTMEINTHLNAGILAKDVSLESTADTTLKWDWQVDELPSSVAEDTATTHDYLSVAILFDNGQDISYVWSSGLEQETAFRCPLPDWIDRETHVVIRSDASQLGQWLSEERNVSADYDRYIGGPRPKQITQIWLIANTMFQGGVGRARVANISVGSSSGEASREKIL